MLFLASACVSAEDVPCGDGTFCAGGTVCASFESTEGVSEMRCVRPEQRSACVDQPAFATCAVSEIPDGRCYDGVCLPGGCGNGRVDPDEVCDDANAASGDGCSAACQSDESCGNTIVDPGEQCDDGNFIAHDGCSRTCRAEVSRWTRLVLGAPSARAEHTLVYVSRRGRVVMFGGAPRGQLPADDLWEWDGHGWRQYRPTFRPPARLGHASSYDAERDRVVVFGGAVNATGVEASVFNDTWEWDGTRWEVKAPAVRPLSRTDAAMAYDPRTKVTVMYGGSLSTAGDGTEIRDLSTWEWDGTTWTQYTQAKTPDEQQGHVMAFDPVRDVLVMVGRKFVPINNVSTEVTGVWEYRNHEWIDTPYPVNAGPVPDPRFGAAMAFDAARGELVMFSGNGSATGLQPEAWAWNGTRWQYIADTELPSVDHAVAFDPTHGLISYGGSDDRGIVQQSRNTTYAWENNKWVLLPVGEPGERRGHIAALEPQRARMIMAGGHTGKTTAWQLVGDSWRLVPSEAPALPDLSAIATAPDGSLVAFGGGTTWTFAADAWTDRGTTGPSSRASHAMATAKDHVVLFGGKTGSVFHGDTWAWEGGAWMPQTTPVAPAKRAGHMMAYDPIRQVVVLFGGNGEGSERYDDTWEWDGETWTRRDLVTRPTARAYGGMAWDPARKRLVLYGGENSAATKLDDAWEYDGAVWTRVDTPLVPDARSMHTLVSSPDGRGVVLFGGRATASATDPGLSELWRLRWESAEADETCSGLADGDADGAFGCDDEECWATCTSCGDGTCSGELESCRTCPDDCTCIPVCGDLVCDPGETCPGDC